MTDLETLLQNQKKHRKQDEGRFWGHVRVAFLKRGDWPAYRRVETKYKDGFPDVFAMDASRRFHAIELKHVPRGNHVALSPQQVSFHNVNREGLSWILVKEKNIPAEVYSLYHASQVVDLALDGLKIEPYKRVEGKAKLPEILEYLSEVPINDIVCHSGYEGVPDCQG